MLLTYPEHDFLPTSCTPGRAATLLSRRSRQSHQSRLSRQRASSSPTGSSQKPPGHYYGRRHNTLSTQLQTRAMQPLSDQQCSANPVAPPSLRCARPCRRACPNCRSIPAHPLPLRVPCADPGCLTRPPGPCCRCDASFPAGDLRRFLKTGVFPDAMRSYQNDDLAGKKYS